MQRKQVLHCAVLVLLGVMTYSGTLEFPFQFDDAPNIIDNPIIKDISFFTDTSRASGFARFDALRSRYIGYLTFFLNYRLHGLNVAGYHAANIFIHVSNALLMYALIFLSFHTPVLRESRLFERRHWTALLASALFVVHPVSTQAVTYIVQRFASLAALLYLGAMVCYLRARLSNKHISQHGYYLLCLFCSLAAMKTKENAFTLPFAITLYELLFFQGVALKKRALFLLPILLTTLIIPITLVDLDRPVTQVMSDMAEKTSVQPMDRPDYFLTEMRVIMTYVRLLILPMNQNLDYSYPRYSSITELPVIISFIIVMVFIVFVRFLFKKRDAAARLSSYGILFFFLSLSVESSFIPLFPIYEHRLYLPGIGLLISASTGLVWLYNTNQGCWNRRLLVVFYGAMVIVLATLSVERNTIWQSELTLWHDVIKKAPGNARGQMALGVAYDRLGNFEKAEQFYLSAIKLRPNFSQAYINLGASYGMQGKLADASDVLEHAIRLDPEDADAYNNLGNVFFASGELDKAVQFYAEALEHDAGAVSPRVNLFKIFMKQGEEKRANEELKYLRQLAPKQAEALAPLLDGTYKSGRTVKE